MERNNFASQLIKRAWRWFQAKWWRFSGWRWLAVIFLGLILVGCVKYTYLAKTTNVKGLESRLKQSTIIYDSSGKKAGTLYSQKGTWVSLDKISPNVVNAVLSTEDRNFYHEYGFSATGILRAALSNIKNRLMGNDTISGGGSTLTQQLVKNAFLSQEQTMGRKLKEIFLAVQVENTYTKKQILTMYLNNAYFGDGIWGIQDAAKRYFGVNAAQLSVAQAAVLAGMLSNPSDYSPVTHQKQAIARRNVVLQAMVANKKLSQSQATKLKATTITVVNKYKYKSGYKYPYYFDAVIEEAMSKYHLSETEIMNGGYKIYTTLNQNYQKSLQSAYDDSYLFPDTTTKAKSQGASIAIDPNNGGITAMVGGRSGTHAFLGYNRATQLSRSPGSTIKPLAVYTPALEAGYSVTSTVQDKLQTYGKNKYEPHNWNNVYSGSLPMYEALALSKNTSAVWLLNKIGVTTGYDSAQKFGLKLNSSDKNLSLALGGLTQGTSPLVMARAYAVFANGGTYYPTYTITKIVDASGKTVATHQPSSGKKIISKAIADKMTSMLLDVYNTSYGTGATAKPTGYTIAGKTGSTQSNTGTNNTDEWYIGYTKKVVVATWVGYDNSNYTVTAGSGASLFKQTMTAILNNTEASSFDVTAAGSSSSSATANKSNSSSNSTWSQITESAQNAWNSFKQSIGNASNQISKWLGN